jgi:hypothetical protein
MICPFCKETIIDGAIKCRHCGSMLNTNPAYGSSADDMSTDQIRAFVGVNEQFYLQQFAKFRITGIEKFCVTWNWSCFGFTWLWFLYRKMYLLAVLAFVVFCLPGINIILHILAGVAGNYLYYCHVKQKLLDIRRIPMQRDMSLVYREVGGVHKWVITVGVILGVIMTMLFAIFFSTMIAFMGHHMNTLTI